MVKRMFFVFVAVIMASNVMAQDLERVVALEKGQTIWGILESQGCSTEEISILWPLVVQDSGLSVDEDRQYPVGTLVNLRRSCNGEPLVSTQSESLMLQNETLRQENTGLKTRNEILNAENETLKTQLADTDVSVGPQQWSWQLLGLGILAGILAGFYLASWLSSPKRQEESQVVTLPQAVEGEDFPKQVLVSTKEGVEVVFHRDSDPSKMMLWYKCPDLGCQKKIGSPKKCSDHWRRNHESSGEAVDDGLSQFPEERNVRRQKMAS